MSMFGEKCSKVLKQYNEMFEGGFPTIPLALSRSEDEIIEIINRCISEKKDVYDLGYLSIDEIY